MTTKYLLPCSCGQEVPVEAAMAGALIRCACGKELEVPTMQHVRHLKVAPQEASKGPPASSWGNRQRVALIGVTFLLLGLALSGWNMWYYHPPTLLPVQDYPPEAAWNLWCRAA